MHQARDRALTIFWHGNAMRCVVLPCLCLVTACAEGRVDKHADDLLAQDPVIARALHDPLMTDPDLASRNEANALVTIADSHALPMFAATDADRRAAREALRLELLDDGPIPDLPRAEVTEGSTARGSEALGPEAGPEALLAAVGAPLSCAHTLREDFALAARLPSAASIPRLAMVVQAGGADGDPCALRIIRYQIPAAPEDVLQYHFTLATRAGLHAERKAAKGGIITATGKSGERLAVHVREGANGLTGTLVIHRLH